LGDGIEKGPGLPDSGILAITKKRSGSGYVALGGNLGNENNPLKRGEFKGKELIMRVLITLSACWVLVLSVTVLADYNLLHMESEDSPPPPPFTIQRVEAEGSMLRVFLSTVAPDGVARLLDAGDLLGQISDHNGEDGAFWFVGLALGKAVVCTADAAPLYLAYSDPLPCPSPMSVEYFLQTDNSLGPGRDLAIGYDPYHLWLIEEAP
jgi:hypothetical protein